MSNSVYLSTTPPVSKRKNISYYLDWALQLFPPGTKLTLSHTREKAALALFNAAQDAARPLRDELALQTPLIKSALDYVAWHDGEGDVGEQCALFAELIRQAEAYKKAKGS